MIDYNIVYFIIFIGTFAMSTYRIVTNNSKVIIACKFINQSNRLFVFIAVLGLLTLVVNYSLIDVIRSFVMFLAILSFMFIKSGLGNDGIYNNGTVYYYKDLGNYEIVDGKKTFRVKYRTINNTSGFNGYLLFENHKKDDVMIFLENKFAKKGLSGKK